MIVADNVVRDGALADADSDEPASLGVRRLHELLAAEPRVTATTIQTVGAKGYDGFTIALVGPADPRPGPRREEAQADDRHAGPGAATWPTSSTASSRTGKAKTPARAPQAKSRRATVTATQSARRAPRPAAATREHPAREGHDRLAARASRRRRGNAWPTMAAATAA